MAMPLAGISSAVRSAIAMSGRPAYGRPEGMSPTTLDAEAVQRENGDHRGGGQHADQRPRRPGREPREQPEGRPAPTAPTKIVGRCSSSQPGDERPHLVDEFVALHRSAGDLAKLAGDHDDRDAGHVSDQHRLRQQLGEKAQPDTRGPAGRSHRQTARRPPPMRRTGRRRRRPAAQVRSRSSARWSTPVPPTAAATSPARAYTASGAIDAHSPTTGGRPATVAYAITCGTMYAATVTPASTSRAARTARIRGTARAPAPTRTT